MNLIRNFISFALVLSGVLLAAGCEQSKRADRTIDQDPDQMVLKNLEKAGSDLTKSHKIDFHILLPNQKKAEAACKELKKNNVQTRVAISGDEKDWTCTVHIEMVPNISKIKSLQKDFKAVAQKYNGTIDGWGAEVAN